MDRESPKRTVASTPKKLLFAGFAVVSIIAGPSTAQTSVDAPIEYTWSIFKDLCGSFASDPNPFLQNPGTFRVDDWLWIMRASVDVGHYEFHTQGPNENPWLDANIDIRDEGAQLYCDAIAYDDKFSGADDALSEVLRILGKDSSVGVTIGSIEPVRGPGSIDDLSDYSSASYILRVRSVFDHLNATVTASIEEDGFVYFGLNVFLSQDQ